MAGIFWFIGWQAVGLCLSFTVFKGEALQKRLWLGSCFGSLLSAWSPVPFSFIFGFTRGAHYLAAGSAIIPLLISLIFSRQKHLAVDKDNTGYSALLCSLPLCAVSFIILMNHTLTVQAGGLYTGQCTYGDMSMHLGFITSIAGQGTFPPYYSILPSAQLCYPFLCDTISASLYLLGTPLRWAYMLPSFFALTQVFTGFWFMAYEITGNKKAANLAYIFFFLNGGFGTIYFLNGEHTLSELLTGFYITPTNLTKSGIRWVNVIADMLIPQRATLYGWSILVPALYLLFKAVYRREGKHYLYAAGILGGLLPMLHTHSFFALGLVAMCWMVASFIGKRDFSVWFTVWVRFGLTAVLLAVPQLITWTFHSVGGNEHFLRIGIDWVNGLEENWFIFWIKNIGLLFIIAPVAYYRLLKQKSTKTGIFAPVFFIFILGEIVLFQPNPYDNNKLFYVGYMFTCVMSAEFLCASLDKLKYEPRIAVTVLLLLLTTNAAFLTLTREIVSGINGYSYQLFNANDLEAAEYINANTAPDSVFLTTDNHNNTVAVLTGRNIVCGSPSYVYYHGLNYSGALADEQRMLTDCNAFEELHSIYGIDYVYISRHEKSINTDKEYFDLYYEVVFQNAEITIYSVR